MEENEVVNTEEVIVVETPTDVDGTVADSESEE